MEGHSGEVGWERFGVGSHKVCALPLGIATEQFLPSLSFSSNYFTGLENFACDTKTNKLECRNARHEKRYKYENLVCGQF